MTEKTKVPRDQNVCFWCKYADHSIPACRRRAPASTMSDGDRTETVNYMIEWPPIDLAHDWCGEFEEGTCMELLEREPKSVDLRDGIYEIASQTGHIVDRDEN